MLTPFSSVSGTTEHPRFQTFSPDLYVKKFFAPVRPVFDVLARRLRMFVLGWVLFMLVVLAWRLAAAPIRVDAIRPVIVSRLESALPGTHASIGHLDLVWFGDARAVGFRFQDLRILDSHHRIVARAGHMEMALAADGLLMARIAPARLTADDFFLAASVSREGRYDLGYEANGAPSETGGLDKFFYDLTGRERLSRPASFVRQASLRNGEVRLIEQARDPRHMGVDWTAHVARVDFTKLHGRLASHADLSIAPTGAPAATLRAAAEGQVGLKNMVLSASLSHLDPAYVAPSSGVTRLLAGVRAPVSGLARINYTQGRGFENAWLDVSAGAGRLDIGDMHQTFQEARVRVTYDSASHTARFTTFRITSPRIDGDLSGRIVIQPHNDKTGANMVIAYDFSGPRLRGNLADDYAPQTLTDAHFRGRYVPRDRRFRIDSGTGLLNGAPLKTQGTLYTDDQGRLGADLTAKIEGRFTKEEVFAFWPQDLAPQTRRMLIERIRQGDFANADFTLKAPPGHFVADGLTNDDLRLDFDFSGLEVAIDPRMHDAEGLSGHGLLLGDSFRMDVTGGRLIKVGLKRGRLSVPSFHDHRTRTLIALDAEGQAADVIEAIDPLADGGLTQHGLTAQRLNGDAAAHVEISFPTLQEITDRNFSVVFDGHIANAGLKQAALGWDLSGGELDVKGDLLADRLDIAGPARVGPFTGDIAYHTQFQPKTQAVDFKGRFNAAQFGGSPRVPVGITGHFTITGGAGQGDVDADIFKGHVDWSGGEKDAQGRPDQVTIAGDTLRSGMEAQGLPIFEHLRPQLPTRITLLRSGDIWSGEIDAEALSGDIAYIEGERPRLVYKSTITPLAARELGYGALPMFKAPRRLTVNIALDNDSKEALITLDAMKGVLGWKEIPGSDDVLRRFDMTVTPDDWATLGLPTAFFHPKEDVPVTALWRQSERLLQGQVRLMGQSIDFDMPLHPYGEVENPPPLIADAATPPPHVLQVRGQVTPDMLATLGYTQDPVSVDGPLGVVFTLFDQPGQPGAVLNVDGAQARIGVRRTDWTKPAGEAAHLAVSFDAQGDDPLQAQGLNLSRIYADGAQIGIDGRAAFDPDGNLEFFDFNRFYLKDFVDFAASYYHNAANDVISVSGQRLDLRPWLDATPDAQAVSAQTPPPSGRPTHIVVDLAHLQMAPDGAFGALKLDLNWDGHNGVSGEGSARTDNGAAMRLSMQAKKGQAKAGQDKTGAEADYSLFSLRLDDLGNAVRTATGNHNLYGGQAVLEGAYKDGMADAWLRGQDIRAKQIPVLAQLLSVATLTGLNDTLAGDGILFREFDFPVRYRPHELFIRDGYLKGKALGLNIWGVTDPDAHTLDFSGTLIPAYSVNSWFGDVKRNGLGLVGIRYDLRGSYKAPQVTINPFSMVLPGFIRKIGEEKRKDPVEALDLPDYSDALKAMRGKE